MSADVDVLVIGAGQAGLAVSHELGSAGVEHVVLEADRIARAWSARWDSFHLVTPNHTVRLPGGEYRGEEPHGFMARDEVLAHLREYRGEAVLLVHNLAPSAEAVELALADFRGAVPVELLGGSRFPAIGDRPYALTLAPYGSYWLRLDRPGRTAEAYGIERDSV